VSRSAVFLIGGTQDTGEFPADGGCALAPPPRGSGAAQLALSPSNFAEVDGPHGGGERIRVMTLELVGQFKRRKLAIAAVAVAIAAGALVLVWKTGVFGDQPAAVSQMSCSGPWSACSPDAQWLRRVLAEAGYPEAGPGTGSALVIPSANPSSQTFLWAVRSHRPRVVEVYPSYDRLSRVGHTSIYGDRVRLLWRAQGRFVYFEPLSVDPLPLRDRKLLPQLVRLTQRVPAPPE
jgi:hypothetical protein